MEKLITAIYTTEYAHPLKRPPAQLIGGLDAWKREGGSVNKDTNEMPEDNRDNTKISEENQVQTISLVDNDLPVLPVPTVFPSNTNTPHDPHERWIPTRPRSSTDNSGGRHPYYSTQTPIVKYT